MAAKREKRPPGERREGLPWLTVKGGLDLGLPAAWVTGTGRSMAWVTRGSRKG